MKASPAMRHCPNLKGKKTLRMWCGCHFVANGREENQKKLAKKEMNAARVCDNPDSTD